MNKNTFITYITHTRKTIFKAYKKAEKIFFLHFFLYIKKTNNYYQKNQRKEFENGLWKLPKSFWRRTWQKAPISSWAVSKSFWRKTKKRQYGCEQEKNLLEDEYRKHSSRTQEIA